MKKFLAVLTTAALACGLALVAIAAPADAHTPTVTADCTTGLTVTMTNYATNGQNKTPNTIKVVVQGATKVDSTFGTDYSGQWNFTPGTAYTYSVDVTAWDDSQYDVHKSGTVTGCATAVTPTAPSFTPPTCTTGGTLVIPTQTGVIYTPATGGAGPGTYHVTARAASGDYTLTGTTSWDIIVPGPTSSSADCVVTPVAPTVKAITACNTDGSIVFPTTTPHVNYVLTSGDGKTGAYTVTATPKAGYTFAGNQVVTYTGNLGSRTTCATPVAPTFTVNSSCTVPGSITLPTTTGVLYTFATGSAGMTSGAYDVVAKPDTAHGYSFVGSQEVHYTGDLGATVPCTTITTAPKAVNITCVQDTDNDTATKVGGYIEVKPVTGITYTITGTTTDGKAITPIVVASTGTAPIDTKVGAGSYTVKATGANLTGTTSWALTVKDDAGLCIPTLPFTSGSVAADPQTCVNGTITSGDITVALDPATLSYTLNGKTLGAKTLVAPGTYTVQMVPVAGFTIDKTSATVTVGGSTAPCGDLKTLAFTGGSLIGAGWLGGAALLLMAGGLFIQRSRRSKLQN